MTLEGALPLNKEYPELEIIAFEEGEEAGFCFGAAWIACKGELGTHEFVAKEAPGSTVLIGALGAVFALRL